MKAFYLAIIGSALLTAYAPNITLASDHINPMAVHSGQTAKSAAVQKAGIIPAAPASCMIVGESQTAGLPYANGGVAAHVYNLTRRLPVELGSRIYFAVGREFIPLNITKTGNGSIISFVGEGDLAMITEATEKPAAVRVLRAHPLWQAAAYIPAQPPAAILSCANATPAQSSQTYQ